MVLSQYGLACRDGKFSIYQFIVGCRSAFSESDITTANQAKLKQKFDSIYILNKRCF